ncbi:MAG TPA: NTP transferase domain-containing protein [Anseongella sp.]|nr:NTP transferase domain-containing protein [Anseongella sp.]
MKPPAIPGLKGLILCGGKSTRMQADKSQLRYHAVPQWQYIFRLLQEHVSDSWVSCRREQADQFGQGINLLFDKETAGVSGPAAGILAGHERFPEAAWLVLACDLPLVTEESIRALARGRKPESPATAFLNPEKNWPEPLLAIWEPAALQLLQRNAGEDRYCPRKTLQECKPFLLNFSHPEELFNANTPEDKALAEDKLKRKGGK